MEEFNINVLFKYLYFTLEHCDKFIAQLPNINFFKISFISPMHFSHDLLYAFVYVIAIVITSNFSSRINVLKILM